MTRRGFDLGAAMGVFEYVAQDSAMLPVRGTLSADSPRTAREQLRQQGLRIFSFRELRLKNASSRLWRLRGSPSPMQLVSWVRDLSTLLSVGIPLPDALSLILSQQRGSWRTILEHLHEQVLKGIPLSQALRNQPAAFDDLTCQLTEVGEATGHLDQILTYLADYKERSLTQTDQAVSALLYPCVVLGAAICVSVFLMVAIVPPLLDNLLDAGKPLPWPTRWLKWLSDGLIHYGVFWLLGMAGTCLFMAVMISTSRGRRLWDAALLRLPLFGELLRKQAISRCVRILAVLSRSGVEFVQALVLAERTLSNSVLREGLAQGRVAIAEGVDLGPALQRSGVFPPLVVQVFAVGQQSGQLEEMLDRLASDYDRQVASVSRRVLTLLEPVLIILLSVIVGFILFATILPILEAGNVL